MIVFSSTVKIALFKILGVDMGSNNLNSCLLKGTPSQIEKIWRHRKHWSLSINYNGRELPFHLSRVVTGKKNLFIRIQLFESDDFGDGLKFTFNFTCFSKRAGEVLWPIKNSMLLCCESGTISKNKIFLSS